MQRNVSTIAIVLAMLMACVATSALSDTWQTSFRHPGILVSLEQLEFIKRHLDQEPWRDAFRQLLNDERARTDYLPSPQERVECGSYSNPDRGCSEEIRDAQAAYAQALLWRLTGNRTYAENVRTILNAWAVTLKGGHTESNAPLQASWAAELFTRSAEIVKYTYSGWPQAEKDRVTDMFATQYLPDIRKMFSGSYACYNKNWHASGVEAMMNIALFNKNTVLFEEAMEKWKNLLPSYIYLTEDGVRPLDATWCQRNDNQIEDHWNRPVAYIDGLTQESCRDFAHTAYGIAAMVNVAETARLQDIDLYDDVLTRAQERLTKAMELHARYQNAPAQQPRLCQADQHPRSHTKGTFEIGYAHYAIREHLALPETKQFLDANRPQVGSFHFMWETLTHGLIGNMQ